MRTEDILRLKGVVNVDGRNNQKIIQAVHEVYDIQDAGSNRPGSSSMNEIVLIGRRLEEEKLLLSLRKCMVNES
jgi:G3E family GTPase